MARVSNRSAKTSNAKSRPALKSNIVTSEELPVAREASLLSDGTREDIAIQGDIHGFKDKAANLAFMEEPVVINISEGTEKNAERYVFLAVNGVGAGPKNSPWVPRGVDVTIKRKYLNNLAGSRPVSYKNSEFVTQLGEIKNTQVAKSADLYPFQVIEDRNPRGREWLRQLRSNRRAG